MTAVPALGGDTTAKFMVTGAGTSSWSRPTGRPDRTPCASSDPAPAMHAPNRVPRAWRSCS